MNSRRLLQAVVAAACLLPLLVGGSGIVHGPTAFGLHDAVPRDLDSHFRYISGIFFATGIGFASCIPQIEHKGARFRLLGALIVIGGFSRGISVLAVGEPSTGHLLGLAMETLVVPLLMLWQWRLARAYRSRANLDPVSAAGRSRGVTRAPFRRS